MRRSTIFVTIVGLAAVGTAAWVVLHPRQSDAPAPERVAPEPTATEVEPPKPEVTRSPLVTLPPEPEPPLRGTPARGVYFKAMVAGDERGLAATRKALKQAMSAPGRTADPAYIHTLESMERTYSERLERHQRAHAGAP